MVAISMCGASTSCRGNINPIFPHQDARLLRVLELEGLDEHSENVTLARSMSASSAIWGEGSFSKDDNHVNNGVYLLVMMRNPVSNWWEIDLGVKMLLNHMVIIVR